MLLPLHTVLWARLHWRLACRLMLHVIMFLSRNKVLVYIITREVISLIISQRKMYLSIKMDMSIFLMVRDLGLRLMKNTFARWPKKVITGTIHYGGMMMEVLLSGSSICFRFLE